MKEVNIMIDLLQEQIAQVQLLVRNYRQEHSDEPVLLLKHRNELIKQLDWYKSLG